MALTTNFGVPVDGASGATLMPKLKYRFRVTFTNLGGSGTDATVVTRNVMTVGRPSISHEPVVVDTYNSKINLAGKHTWEPVSLVVRDDVNSLTIAGIDAQLSRQVNHANQSSARAGVDYKFSMKIETLDGDNNASNDSILDSWELIGCYLEQVQYGDLDYSDSQVVQVTTTIKYDTATHKIGGADIDYLGIVDTNSVNGSVSG